MIRLNNIHFLNKSIYLDYFYTKLLLLKKTYFYFQLNKKDIFFIYSITYFNPAMLYYKFNLLIKYNKLNNIEYEDKENTHILKYRNKINMEKLICICTKKGKKKIIF
jgi:hypothetical protein